MLAFISMLVAFMQADKDSPGDHIGDIENITACTKAVLELVGQAPYLLSFSFFWQGATQALLAMETQYFPDLPCETPSHLAVPRHFLPLSRVTLPSWTHNHRLIAPAFSSMLNLQKWLETTFSAEVQADIFSLCEDLLLLLETVADLCNVQVQNTAPFEA